MSVQEVAPPRLITLTCPTCGAKLKLGDNTNLVYCTSCGNEHLVERADGSIYLAPMAANVAQIRTGVDKTAAELAVVRLQKEIEELNAEFTIASKTNYAAKIPRYPREWLALAAAILSFLAIFACSSAKFGAGINFFLVATLIAFVFVLVSSSKRTKDADALQVRDLNEIDAAIDAKKAMLERNQAVANS